MNSNKQLITLILFSILSITGYSQNTYSLEFDGIDNSVNTSLIPPIGSNERTIMYWAKRDDLSNASQYTSFYGNSNIFPCGQTFRTGFGNGINGVYVGISCSYITYNATVNNEWHHYTYVVPDIPNPNISDIQVFQNGIQLTSIGSSQGSLSQSIVTNNLSTLILGWNSNFSGNMDDFIVFDYALSQEEIQGYITCPPVGNEQGLIGYWKFEEGSGTNVEDMSMNNNDGMINGDAQFIQDTPSYNCPTIPTLSQWGIIALGMLTMIFGVIALRQRKTILT